MATNVWSSLATVPEPALVSSTAANEIARGGGIGRSGTALACMTQLAGVSPADATAWVREDYDSRAVETPWQRVR